MTNNWKFNPIMVMGVSYLLQTAAITQLRHTTTIAAIITPSIRNVINSCYPPTEYSTRRTIAYDAALASTTIYTPEGIPLAGDSMTYGEFDIDFFDRILGKTLPSPGDTFVDIGSGAGRLVVAAALLHSRIWRNCHGVEISLPLHEVAIAARVAFSEIEKITQPPIAPCQYTLSDFAIGDGLDAIRSADVVFSYAVTWNNDDSHRRLIRTLAQELRDGTRVISIDIPLDDGAYTNDETACFNLLAKEVGYNQETGDKTIGYIYRLSRRI